jgi:hypothetical protein
MESSFHIFLEHLINSAYQQQKTRLSQVDFYGKIHSFASSYIRFGGWDINYNGKGWTRLFIERVGKIDIVSKAIYLNVNYTYYLTGLKAYPTLDFSDLINTIAHELAHCLLGDFNLNWAKLHDEKHKILTREIEDYLWTLIEVKELERLIKNHKTIL